MLSLRLWLTFELPSYTLHTVRVAHVMLQGCAGSYALPEPEFWPCDALQANTQKVRAT
jgi:hypothetical protein